MDVDQDITSHDSISGFNHSSDIDYSDLSLKDLFLEKEIDEALYPIVEAQVNEGRMSIHDLTDQVIDLLNQLDAHDQTECLRDFASADLSRVVNKPALLTNILQRKVKECEANKKSEKRKGVNCTTGFRHDKIKSLCDASGYQYSETPSYRRYGPPPGEESNVPQGGEVYVGRIPSNVDEAMLIPYFKDIGKIWDLRYMLNPSDGSSYCFVQYYNKEDANKAVEKLNGREIVRGGSLSVSLSRAYTKLFVGNIPRSKDADELKEKLCQLVDGIRKVTVYPPSSLRDDNKNRGYCFVYFDSQRTASVGKKKLGSASIRVFGRVITVEWAEDRSDEDESALEKVKTLHVKGVGSSVTDDDIQNAFLPYGDVDRVKKVQDYAFVTFMTREQAVNAMEAVDNQCLFGTSKVRVEFARPWSSKGRDRKRRRSRSPFGGRRDAGASNRGYRNGRALDVIMPLSSSSMYSSSISGSRRYPRRNDLELRSRSSSPDFHSVLSLLCSTTLSVATTLLQHKLGAIQFSQIDSIHSGRHGKRRRVSAHKDSRHRQSPEEYNGISSNQWSHLHSSGSGNARSRRPHDTHKISSHTGSYYR